MKRANGEQNLRNKKNAEIFVPNWSNYRRSAISANRNKHHFIDNYTDVLTDPATQLTIPLVTHVSISSPNTFKVCMTSESTLYVLFSRLLSTRTLFENTLRITQTISIAHTVYIHYIHKKCHNARTRAYDTASLVVSLV